MGTPTGSLLPDKMDPWIRNDPFDLRKLRDHLNTPTHKRIANFVLKKKSPRRHFSKPQDQKNQKQLPVSVKIWTMLCSVMYKGYHLKIWKPRQSLKSTENVQRQVKDTMRGESEKQFVLFLRPKTNKRGSRFDKFVWQNAQKNLRFRSSVHFLRDCSQLNAITCCNGLDPMAWP